jgi:dynactin-5
MTEETDYIKTTTHNYVSRQAHIEGAKQVELKGRSILQSNVKVRGDLSITRIGRYCEVCENTNLEPPLHPLTKKYIPIVIGSHTHIGKDCQIQAAAIGSMVWIGDGVHLGKRVIIKDNCVIEDGVILGEDTVIPPFTRVSASNPSLHVELPPATAMQLQEVSLDRFQEFKLQQKRQ